MLAAVGGCYRPSPTECALQCTAASGCPGGLTCETGFCIQPGSGTVCGGDAAELDATDSGVDDATSDAPSTERLYRTLAVGFHHACAVDTMGRLWCWGANESRQLGVVTADDHAAVPQRVLPAMADGEWRDVTAGRAHTCGLWAPTVGDAQLWCWGENYSYQTGSSAASPTPPHQVTTPANQIWRQIAAGGDHTCAVLQSTGGPTQVVMCFGNNERGQLGMTGAAMQAAPMPIDDTAVLPTTTSWRSITSGTDHSCAIADDGKVYCWGDNREGEGGSLVGGFSDKARVIGGASVYTVVAAGDSFSCGIDSVTSVLRCWGRNGAGELGIGMSVNTGNPSAVVDAGASPKWKSIALGQYGACGIQGAAASTDESGTVRCWGANDFGERGDGTFLLATAGPSAGVVDTAFAVGAGHLFACALSGAGAAGGTLRCWGDNADGQIGVGNASDHRRPLRIGESVRAGRSWSAVAAGRAHTCAILAGATADQNELYCWGQSSSGQLDGTVTGLPRRAPVLVAAGSAVTHVVVGSSHTCVRRDPPGGTEIVCWGSDQAQQLGVAGIVGPAPVVAIDNGSIFFTVALLGAGNVTCGTNPAGLRCWGEPELATSSYIDSDTPADVSLTGGVFPNASFTMGASSGCWIEGAQTLCFGSNAFGQLGWGSLSVPSTFPQPVMNLTDATALSVGPGDHRCAITANRVVKCWGANGFGQVGAADAMHKDAPVTVPIPNQYDRVATGLNHTCGLDGSTIYCWGNNDQYQRTAIASMSSLPPTAIRDPQGEGVPAYTQVTAGQFHTCAISDTGALYCWGASRWGQVGAGTASEPSPVQVIDGVP